MKYALGILTWVNLSWANRICTLILVCLLTYSGIRIFEAKAVKQDCTYYIEQNKQLVGALIDIKKMLEPTSASFTGQSTQIIFASYTDTLPKVNAQVNKVLNKIDSILWKLKQDSIKLKTKKS